MNLVHLRSEWAPDAAREVLAGTVVALALIPEAIAFSLIAGVDPKVGLYASFCIAVISAFGRAARDDLRRHGIAVEVVGLNEASASLVERLGAHDKPGAAFTAPGH